MLEEDKWRNLSELKELFLRGGPEVNPNLDTYALNLVGSEFLKKIS